MSAPFLFCIKSKMNPDFCFDSLLRRLGGILSIFIELKLAPREYLELHWVFSFPSYPKSDCLQHHTPQLWKKVGMLSQVVPSYKLSPSDLRKGPNSDSKLDWPESCKVPLKTKANKQREKKPPQLWTSSLNDGLGAVFGNINLEALES